MATFPHRNRRRVAWALAAAVLALPVVASAELVRSPSAAAQTVCPPGLTEDTFTLSCVPFLATGNLPDESDLIFNPNHSAPAQGGAGGVPSGGHGH